MLTTRGRALIVSLAVAATALGMVFHENSYYSMALQDAYRSDKELYGAEEPMGSCGR